MTPINRTFAYKFCKMTLLRLHVRWNGNEIIVSTGGYHINRAMWDGRRCKPNSFHGNSKIPAFSINAALEDLEARVNGVFYSFEMSDRMPGKHEMREAIDLAMGRRTMTLENAWLEFLRDGESKRQWADNTSKSVRQVKNLLAKFRPNLRFQDIDANLLDEFVAYQTKHKLFEPKKQADPDKPKGYANNVIRKNCRVLKWFLRWAAGKGYISADVEQRFKVDVKSIERPVIFLTWPELMRVYNADLTEHPNLAASRDMFCLSCFTSLRYSDASTLTKSQVYDGFIAITTKKTASNLHIELNKYSRSILDRHRDLPGDRALPFVSCSQINRDLKIIGKLCGITDPVTISQFFGSERRMTTRPKYELLSSHCGRRTFICNALALGIPPHVVMKWTGHSEYSAMKPYIDASDSLKAESMSKFDDI